MYYVYYEKDSGKLLQVSEIELSNTLSEMTSFNDTLPDLKAVLWDCNALCFTLKTTILSQVEFLRKFTLSERLHIRSLRDSDPIIEDILDMVDKADYVDLSDQDAINSIYYLASINVIDVTRIQQILGN
jgi:hypothetical protein